MAKKQKTFTYNGGEYKPAEISVNARDYHELTEIREKVKKWKGNIKEQREIESKIRSLAQERLKLEKKEPDLQKKVFESV